MYTVCTFQYFCIYMTSDDHLHTLLSLYNFSLTASPPKEPAVETNHWRDSVYHMGDQYNDNHEENMTIDSMRIWKHGIKKKSTGISAAHRCQKLLKSFLDHITEKVMLLMLIIEYYILHNRLF